jgi:aromatic-L-amino-acid decarboxylase
MSTTFTEVPEATPLEKPSLAIVPAVTSAEIREHLQQFDFAQGRDLEALTREVADMFGRWNLQAPHPGYLGLFNPATSLASVAADALVALYNPQLAVWAHAPAAQELERHVLHFIAGRLGYPPEGFFANFTTGGSEANHTALLAALAHRYPAYLTVGLWALPKRPVIYLSTQSHNSFDKIAKNIGLGLDSLHRIPVDAMLRMDVAALEQQIKADEAAGFEPILIVGTAGTTASGAIDPLPALADTAARHSLWLHVDAAWAGAAVLSDRLRPHLAGIERADSVTIDAHKWFSVAMGAGMFFTRHPQALQAAFNIPATYMPSHLQTEPYVTTLQWSRRCIGLKLFLALAEQGAPGLAQQIERQCDLARYLTERLGAAGWLVVNDSPVGVVNFTHPALGRGAPTALQIQQQLEKDGDFWLSTIPFPGHGSVLRACITSFHTQAETLDDLVQRLNQFVMSGAAVMRA